MEKRKDINAYIDSTSSQLIQLIAFIKDKISLLDKKDMTSAENATLREINMHIESAEKLISGLSEAAKPWQDRVPKKEGSSAQELLKDYTETALRHAAAYGSGLSLIALEVSGMDKLAKPKTAGETSLNLSDLTELVRTGLRRRADFVMSDDRSIYVILPETDGQEAGAVAGRLTNIITDYISMKGQERHVRTSFKIASSPEDGFTFDDLYAALKR